MSSTRRYRRVAEDESTDPETLRRKSRAEVFERVSTKFQAALWVITAILVFIYGKVPASLADTTGARSHQWALSLGWACLGVVATLWAYLVLWLPYVARITLHWQTYVPWAIPTATAAGVGAFLSFVVGLWPAYGLLSPLVVGVLGLGAIMSAHFIPSC